jgi:hypothetical protein
MRVRPLVLVIGISLCAVTWGGRAEARGHARRTHKASSSKRKHRTRRPPPPPEKKAPDPVPEEAAPAPEAQNAAPVPHRGPTRLDFDDRLIQGQTNKAGAVYLYERKELKVRSMVRLRENFRPEIYDSVDGED